MNIIEIMLKSSFKYSEGFHVDCPKCGEKIFHRIIPNFRKGTKRVSYEYDGERVNEETYYEVEEERCEKCGVNSRLSYKLCTCIVDTEPCKDLRCEDHEIPIAVKTWKQ